jgi:hypothetical protein
MKKFSAPEIIHYILLGRFIGFPAIAVFTITTLTVAVPAITVTRAAAGTILLKCPYIQGLHIIPFSLYTCYKTLGAKLIVSPVNCVSANMQLHRYVPA